MNILKAIKSFSASRMYAEQWGTSFTTNKSGNEEEKVTEHFAYVIIKYNNKFYRVSYDLLNQSFKTEGGRMDVDNIFIPKVELSAHNAVDFHDYACRSYLDKFLAA